MYKVDLRGNLAEVWTNYTTNPSHTDIPRLRKGKLGAQVKTGITKSCLLYEMETRPQEASFIWLFQLEAVIILLYFFSQNRLSMTSYIFFLKKKIKIKYFPANFVVINSIKTELYKKS